LIDARCRVTVIGAENRVDLAIPAEASIAEYNDLLARMCGQPQDDALPPAWSLAPVGRAPFPLTSSLALEGVEDGAILYLRDTLAGEDQEPVVHSVWEQVSDFAEKSRGIRWDARATGQVAVVLGAFWVAAALGYLGLSGHRSPALGVIGAVLGLGMAVLARVLRRHPRVLPGTLRTALGCAVIPCTVLVAFLAPGDPAYDGTHVIYLEVGLLLGFVIALIAVPGVLLGASTLLVAIAGVLIAVLAPLRATTPAIAATVVVAGVLFVAVAPRTAGVLVAATWLSMSSPTLEPEPDSERLAERYRQAHRALVLLVSVTSAAVGVAMVVLTRGFSPFTLAVSITATIVLLLRTRTFELASEAVAPVVAAMAGAFGLLTMLARSEATDAYVMPTLFLVGVAAIAVGLPVLLWGADRSPAPGDKPPKLGPLLTVGQIVLPALLLGVYGLYTTLWNLGR
jgi:type VII secretion integral membrane protein EccD